MSNYSIAMSPSRSTSNLVGILLGILVFIRTMPCYLWSIEDIIRPVCAVIILIICITNISKKKGTGWIFLCFACAYIWATVFVDHSGIVTIFNFLAFAFIPILKKSTIDDAYSVFRRIFIFFIFLSLLNYALYLIGVDTSILTINPLNSLKDYKYVMHPFLVTVFGGIRFMSIYDEPGFVGTLCGLILIAERMNLSKSGNIILLIAGLIALSLYFYVALIFGLMLFSKKMKHKWIYMVLFCIFVIATYNNDFMYNTIWSRFEYNAVEGKFAGDNRSTSGIDNLYDAVLGTPLYFTGLGSLATEDLQGGASLKLVILKHGFIFVALNILGYALLAFQQIPSKKDWLFFMIFFILTLYQRPGLYGTYSIFMYTMLIYKFGDLSTTNENEAHINHNQGKTNIGQLK